MAAYMSFFVVLIFFFRNADGPKPTAQIRLDMQKAMQTDAAVFRYISRFTQASIYQGTYTFYSELSKVLMKVSRKCVPSTRVSITLESRIEAWCGTRKCLRKEKISCIC